MHHKADPTVICQCGCLVNKYYMPKHLPVRTAKHAREMEGRENIEVAEERHGDINHVINNIYIHEMFLKILIHII